MIVVICDNCGEEIKRYPSTVSIHNFCCRRCTGKWQSKNQSGEKSPGWQGGKIKSRCHYCGEEIEIMPRDIDRRKFCNCTCQSEWQSEFLRGENHPEYIDRMVVICDNCGEEIKRKPSNIHDHNFCDVVCHGEWLSKNAVAENNPHWKGGITSRSQSFYVSDEWTRCRKEIYRRDNYTCQICGASNCMLHAHHIVPLSQNWDLRLDEKNLITLCMRCHGGQD